MDQLNFIAIAGSLRKGSYNRLLLEAAKEFLPDHVNLEILEIGNLPLFNEDLEADFPQEAQNLKEKISAADGAIIATPEYNRSISGVLKNALDWTSRPYGQNAWPKTPVYVMGASIGPISTAIAQSHLKHTMLYLDAYVLGQPEFYMGDATQKFDDNGKLTHENTRDFLKECMDVFVKFAQK